MPNNQCPATEQLSAYVLGQTDDASSEILDSHLLHCKSCQTILAHSNPLDDTLVSAIKQGLTPCEFDSEPALQEAINRVSKQEFRRQVETKAIDNESGEFETLMGSDEKTSLMLGPYRLLKVLGKGGMGQVYLAEHSRLEMTVALKVLAEHLTNDPQAIPRFDREMKAVGRFNHPNIVRATDAGEFQGQHYLAMEFVDGRDICDVVAASGPLRISDACEMIRQAAVGIQHAHEHNLIHRDLKPSNLMVTKDGLVKVLDLGLARLQPKSGEGLTSDFQIMGTADYMAPEQALKALEVDSRVDIYSLGCTLYALLCGRPPFADEKHSTSLRKIMAHEQEQPMKVHERRSEIPVPLSEIVDKAMAKLPSDRFESAGDLAIALLPFAEGADLASLYQSGTSTSDQTAKNTSDIAKHLAMTDTQTSMKPKPLPFATPPSRFSRLWWLAVAIMLFAGAGAASLILRFKSANGTIIVEIEGDQFQTSLDGERIVVEDKSKGTIYHLSISGDQTQTPLSPGNYAIRVENEASGLKFDTHEFQITRNNATVVKAYLQQTAMAAPVVPESPNLPNSIPPTAESASKSFAPSPPKPSPQDYDRQVAEVMIERGAMVHVKIGNSYQSAAAIAKLPLVKFKISRVEFLSSYELTDEDFESLVNLKELAALDLCDVIISERVINYLIRIKSLSLLWLKYNEGPVTGLERLVRLPTPYNLKLQGSAVGDAEVKAMSQLVRVRFLSLSGKGFTDECIPDIVKISEIAELSIENSRVTGSGFKHLADLPRLETLQVPGSLVGDAHLKDLVGIKRLKMLNLTNSRITDKAVDVLQTLTQLKHLIVDSRLTKDAVENLRSKLPDCKVVAGR